MIDRRGLVAGSVAISASLCWPGFARTQAREEESGWRPLFDGNSLNSWTFYQEGFGNTDKHSAVSIDNGVLHFLGPDYEGKGAPPGHIATMDEWENYHLRLEYRWGTSRCPPRKLQRRNSGILYHMGPESNRLFPDCVEFQVEESDVGDAVMINTLALQGPLLGGTPLWPNWIQAFPDEYQEPVRAGGMVRQWHRHAGYYEKLDDWNILDLYAIGDQAAHLVNGRIVNTLF